MEITHIIFDEYKDWVEAERKAKMEVLPLNLKYRPDTLDEMWGHYGYYNAVESFLEREDRPRTYLFYGPPGCGKTTLARIFAKEIGGQIKEFNISNTTGVDAARGIINKLKYKSLKGARVLIFNECHRASPNFQDAMLETLEEPPADTYFILVTTEPRKLLSAVRSRCTKIELKPLNRKDTIGLLHDTCIQEEIELDAQIIKQIARISDGVPRDALVLLNKVIDLDPSEQKDFVEDLKTFESTTLELCKALQNRIPWDKVVPIIKALDEEPETVRYAILGYFSKDLLKTGSVRSWQILDVFGSTFFHSKKAGLIKACFEIINTD